MWLYVTSRGYRPPVRGYTTRCSPDASAFFFDASASYQENPGVHNRGYMTHIVIMRGYILYLYRKGARTFR